MFKYFITDSLRVGTLLYGDYSPQEMLLILGALSVNGSNRFEICDFLIKRCHFKCKIIKTTLVQFKDSNKVSCFDLITETIYHKNECYLSDIDAIKEYFISNNCTQMLLSLDWDNVTNRYQS